MNERFIRAIAVCDLPIEMWDTLAVWRDKGLRGARDIVEAIEDDPHEFFRGAAWSFVEYSGRKVVDREPVSGVFILRDSVVATKAKKGK